MSVAIRLKRHGTRNRPFYRIVVMDSRRPRDGRVIEEVGRYQPTEPEGAQATLDEVRVREWMGKGARPSPTVRRILNRQTHGQARGAEIGEGQNPESEE
jgi:small subunit ribosomal protein S16